MARSGEIEHVKDNALKPYAQSSSAVLASAGSGTFIWLLLLAWLACIGVALKLDAVVASRIYTSGLYNTVRWSHAMQLSKTPGTFYLSIAIGAILCCWPGQGVRPALLLWLSGMVAGFYYVLGKWIIGRSRPIFDNGKFNAHPFNFDYFHDGWRGLLVSHPNLSFPSGHTALAFASAMALGMLFPRWRIAFFLLALVVAVQRILEGSHYLSDVVAGAGVGVLAALSAWTLLRRLELLPAQKAN